MLDVRCNIGQRVRSGVHVRHLLLMELFVADDDNVIDVYAELKSMRWTLWQAVKSREENSCDDRC